MNLSTLPNLPAANVHILLPAKPTDCQCHRFEHMVDSIDLYSCKACKLLPEPTGNKTLVEHLLYCKKEHRRVPHDPANGVYFEFKRHWILEWQNNNLQWIFPTTEMQRWKKLLWAIESTLRFIPGKRYNSPALLRYLKQT